MYEALFGPQHANKGRTLDLQITKWGYFCRKSTFMKSAESSNTNSKWVGNLTEWKIWVQIHNIYALECEDMVKI